MYIFTLYRTSVIIQLWRYRDTTATITISFCCCCCNCCHYCYLGMMTGTACDNDTIKGILTCVSPHWYWRVSLWNIPVPTDTQIESLPVSTDTVSPSLCLQIPRLSLSLYLQIPSQIESIPVPQNYSIWLYQMYTFWLYTFWVYESYTLCNTIHQ